MSSKNQFELHKDRLATTDEKGKRVYLHPEDIKGKWKTRRTAFYWFLISLYLVLPWIYINGKQVILLDLAHREFYIFGTTFYGHDGPLLIFVLIGFVLIISFLTSLYGRIWCGWACPQTVFIDSIYRKIDSLVEGKARQRKALDQSPWDFTKIWKKSLKWILYTAVSLHIVHSFLGYFAGTHKLFWISMGNPHEHWTLFMTMLVMTGIILFDFGWFKEQFCIIACPYGRFQSVAMDANSLVVAYDSKRGEPRRNLKVLPKDQEGDCINCFRCVKACPTGIDIRRGTQLECIACTMCIDACDEIMTKLHRPEGLIKYTTETELNGGKKKIGGRSLIYLVLFIVLIAGFFISLNKRTEFRAQFLRGSKSPFQTIPLQDGRLQIVNHFTMKLYFNNARNEKIDFILDNPADHDGLEIIIPGDVIVLNKDNTVANIFFKFKKDYLTKGSRILKVHFKDKNKVILKTYDVKLVGPIN